MDPALTNVLVTPHVGIYTEETLRRSISWLWKIW